MITIELKTTNIDCLTTPLEMMTLRNQFTGLFTLHHLWICAN